MGPRHKGTSFKGQLFVRLYNVTAQISLLLIATPCLVAQASNSKQTYTARRIAQAKSKKSQAVNTNGLNSPKGKSFINHVQTRIQESWTTYEVSNITAKVLLTINGAGHIVSTKLLSSTGPSDSMDKVIEAVTYATPFGQPPTNGTMVNLTVNFRQNRVTVDTGTSENTARSANMVKNQPSTKTAATKRLIQSSLPVKDPATVHREVMNTPANHKPYNTDRTARELLDYLNN